MASFEDYQNNKFFKLGGRLGDLMALSGLWLLYSLPIVTIGASTAALYYGVNKCFVKGSDQPAKEFRHSFRDNAKQGILLSIIYIIFCGFIVFDIAASFKGIGGIQLPKNYRMFAYVLILPVVFTLFFIFPYISRFSADTKTALRNSFLLSASHIDHIVYLVLLNAATLALCALFPPAVLVLPALCTLISSRMIEKDFEQAQKLAEKAAASSEAADETEDGSDDEADESCEDNDEYDDDDYEDDDEDDDQSEDDEPTDD